VKKADEHMRQIGKKREGYDQQQDAIHASKKKLGRGRERALQLLTEGKKAKKGTPVTPGKVACKWVRTI